MYYGVLIYVSTAYPPAIGRLHTRYAPVRRSCVTEVTLPLDLHVLGLPLALILSQDQTLRCICSITCLFRPRLFSCEIDIVNIAINSLVHTRSFVYLFIHSKNFLIAAFDNYCCNHFLITSLKWECKSRTFYFTTQIYSEIFLMLIAHHLSNSLLPPLLIPNKCPFDFLKNRKGNTLFCLLKRLS